MGKPSLNNPALEKILDSLSSRELRAIEPYIYHRLNVLYYERKFIDEGLRKGTPEILDVSIMGETPISTRLTNLLREHHIRTLLQVKDLGLANLLKLPGIGKKAIDELCEEFDRRGHVLK
jgi:hypothetical protein